MTNGLDYRVTWHESSGKQGWFPKEVLFQYPYARDPEQEALSLVEELRTEPNLYGKEVGNIKIQRRVVSNWMECIGV